MKKKVQNHKISQNFDNKKNESNISTTFLFTKGSIIRALAIIFILTFIAYFSALDNEFTNWDDKNYVLQNKHIKEASTENIYNLFFGEECFYMGNYHPFTMLSFLFDYQFAELTPFAYHLHNVILHIFNSLLVFAFLFLLLQRLKFKSTLFIATLVAIMFGINTLHTESVAWVSERKDVLYTFFYLISIILYLKFTESKKPAFYIFSLLTFVFSLLAKAQAVTLAPTLILIDLLLDRKLVSIKNFIEKFPFFIFSLIFGIIALKAQASDEAIHSYTEFPIYGRFVYAAYGLCMYVFKTFIPINLAAVYPYPDIFYGTIPKSYFLFLFPVSLAVFFLFRFFNRKSLFIFGILFFLVNISIVLQFIPVGSSIMSDRYAYLPSIGLFIFFATAILKVIEKSSKHKKIIISFIGIYVLVIIFLTIRQNNVWHDSLTLWNQTISVSPNSPIAWNNRGSAKDKLKQRTAAIADFSQAIKLKPDYTNAYFNRAIAQDGIGKLEEALTDYSKVIELKELKKANNPHKDVANLAMAYTSRGVVYGKIGNINAALADFNKAIEVSPNYALAYSNRGFAKTHINKHDEALNDYNFAIQLDSTIIEAWYNRGNHWLNAEKYDSAIADYQKVISLNVDYELVYYNYALAFYKKGEIKKAKTLFSKQIELKPKQAFSYYMRAKISIEQGENQAACSDFRKALELGYNYAKAEIEKYCK